MGSHFRTIVDPMATAEEAPALARKVIDWFIDRKIIQPERDKDGLYPPGPNVEVALATWSPSETPGKFGKPLHSLRL
jgi:hypothetical protein